MCTYTLQLADDQVVIANDKDHLEYMTQKIQEEYRKWGLEINNKKMKYLLIGAKLSNISFEKNNQEITPCEAYTYQGVIFDRTGIDNREIQARITQAREIIGCINGILWNSEISKRRKYNIYNTLVKSSLLTELKLDASLNKQKEARSGRDGRNKKFIRNIKKGIEFETKNCVEG